MVIGQINANVDSGDERKSRRMTRADLAVLSTISLLFGLLIIIRGLLQGG
jgi:hypothetical protein